VHVEEEKGLVRAWSTTLARRWSRRSRTSGEPLAYDGKAIGSPSTATGRENRETGQTSDPDTD